MPWDDSSTFETELTKALAEFDWAKAEAVCERLIARVRSEPEVLPDRAARNLLQELGQSRRFELMSRVGEALLQSGARDPRVRRLYAQSLIDRGRLDEAEAEVRRILTDPQSLPVERLEARGLAGRISKQRYINNRDPQSPANRAHLERAVGEYYGAYREDPRRYWHGINALALAARAQRDGLPAAGLPDHAALAEEILATLKQLEDESAEGLDAWGRATVLEANVALGRHRAAAAEAARYAFARDATAFKLGSTLRQLTEVWQLDEQSAPGDLVLPICKAGYLEKAGAFLDGDPRRLAAGRRAADAALQSTADGGFEKVFGKDAAVTLDWYRKGLAQCDSVARIESLDGKGFGTGWLVEAADFFPDRRGPLLLTNEHVLSEDDMTPGPYASLPEDAQADFQSAGQVIPVGEIVCSSPRGKLDATFVTLKGEPRPKALALSERAMKMADPPPRMYIIGHPDGRDLELSLQDNNLLACDDRRLHYRTPTEPGSSGSPVFEPKGWRVVALHHKGSNTLARIDGEPGTYQANEGISIAAIQAWTRAGCPDT